MASAEFDKARGRAVQDYGLARQAFFDEIGLDDRARAQAFQDQAYYDAQMSDHMNQLFRLAGFGGQATSEAANVAARAGDAYGNAAQYGVEGVGAARLGSANANIQSTFAKQQGLQDAVSGLSDIWDIFSEE